MRHVRKTVWHTVCHTQPAGRGRLSSPCPRTPPNSVLRGDTPHHEAGLKTASEQHERQLDGISQDADTTSSSPPSDTTKYTAQVGGRDHHLVSRVVHEVEPEAVIDAHLSGCVASRRTEPRPPSSTSSASISLGLRRSGDWRLASWRVTASRSARRSGVSHRFGRVPGRPEPRRSPGSPRGPALAATRPTGDPGARCARPYAERPATAE